MIFQLIDEAIGRLWRHCRGDRAKKPGTGQLTLGRVIEDGETTRRHATLTQAARTRHVAVLGKTGSGKSYLLRHIAQQDIQNGHGFTLFDQHGDLIPPILSFLAEAGIDPSRVILIDPASSEWAVGLNPLEASDEHSRFRMAAEITRNLADRWDFKGARTEEVLRNALFVLSANGLTLLETSPLLADAAFRSQLLKQVDNCDVREFFTNRYDKLSDAMQATVREPVLNKLSELTTDPHFRHILGQRQSTFSFDDALATGKIVLVNIPKGRLGIHAMSFGSLALTKLTAAIFRRSNRSLYTILVDEVQNLVSAETDFDVLFSESRKFGCGLVIAHQFLAQLPGTMQSAVQAIGTRIFFQLSPEDATRAAQEMDAGKSVAGRLKNLAPRHFVMKSGSQPAVEAAVPEVYTARSSSTGFVDAVNGIDARRRADVEGDIRARRPRAVRKSLEGWD